MDPLESLLVRGIKFSEGLSYRTIGLQSHVAVMKLLLEKSAELKSEDQISRTLLSCAAVMREPGYLDCLT
jgi:hypothetical protein